MIGIIKQLKDNKQTGFSIVEIVVAVSIFAVIMVIAMDSFISVINVNRESRQYQALQDHTRFLFEMMTKELRTAQVNLDSSCNRDNWGTTSVYNIETDGDDQQSLYFKNYHGECVQYRLDGDQLKINRGAGEVVMMPSSIKVKDLQFDITNLQYAEATNNPPSVTFYVKLESAIWNPSAVELQTTVTSRYIE